MKVRVALLDEAGKIDVRAIPDGVVGTAPVSSDLQSWSWFFPGPVVLRSGVAAVSVPTFGPRVELLGLSLTVTMRGTASGGDNNVEVRVNVNDVPVGTGRIPAPSFQWHMRKDHPAPSARVFVDTPLLIPESYLTVDITRVLSDASAQPENLTVQLWWRWRDAV